MHAFLLGLLVAVPLGPVGATVIRTGLVRGFLPAPAFIGTGTLSWFTCLAGATVWGRRLAGDVALWWASAAASVIILGFAIRFLIQGLEEYLL